MWLCMWKLTISEEILIWFLDYFNIFALCEQLWKIRILGPLLRQKRSPLGPLFAKNWVPFGSPFYNFWVPLIFGNSEEVGNIQTLQSSSSHQLAGDQLDQHKWGSSPGKNQQILIQLNFMPCDLIIICLPLISCHCRHFYHHCHHKIVPRWHTSSSI